MKKMYRHPLILMFLACSLLFTLLMFACTSDDDDDVDPTPTPTLVPTATPTPLPEPGTLHIWTTPEPGDIYVDGELVGNGEWTHDVEAGTYAISFGAINGYTTPAEQTVEVHEAETVDVEGVYYVIPCRIYNITVNGNPYDYGTYHTSSWCELSIEFDFEGLYWDAEHDQMDIPQDSAWVYPTHGEGTGHYTIAFYTGVPFFTYFKKVQIFGTGVNDTSYEEIKFSLYYECE
jgi:hypothetical protein